VHSWNLNSVCVGVVDQIEKKKLLQKVQLLLTSTFHIQMCLSHCSRDVFHHLRGCAGALCVFCLGYNLWLYHFNPPPKIHTWKCIKRVLWTFLCSSFKQLWFMYYMGKIWEFQHLSMYINDSVKKVTLECNHGRKVLTWHTISCYI
jgi:hypothetical protein